MKYETGEQGSLWQLRQQGRQTQTLSQGRALTGPWSPAYKCPVLGKHKSACRQALGLVGLLPKDK